MKKIMLLVVAMIATVFSTNAQVKVESPSQDLDVQVTRVAYASGTLTIDMLITNFGPSAVVDFTNTTTSSRGVIAAYDDEGNAYNFRNNDNLKIGIVSDGLKKVFHNEYTFPQDISLKFRVQLPNISSTATKITLLTLPIESSGALSISRGSSIIIHNLEWIK